MRQIVDFHIHSRFSRACSRDLTLENLDRTCRIKGVDIIATGDFTYPEWFSEMKDALEVYKSNTGSQAKTGFKKNATRNTQHATTQGSNAKDEGGLYVFKNAKDDKIKFFLSTELALIYKKFDKVRRLHIVVHAPNLEAVEELNKYLDKRYNIRSDGRPILGMSAEELCKLCLAIHPKFLIYPAHIWTPWFSVFGSKSGFDTIEECFGEFTDRIYAYETGLSSDPEMNWRLSALDNLTLLSNSDAHSLPNIGRECNVFELAAVSYDTIYDVIKNQNRRDAINRVSTDTDNKSYLDYTIEFYPEEGMYHYDGHRVCGVRFRPAETKKHKGICPVCKKPLVIGVMNRVDELADRPVFVGTEQCSVLTKAGKPENKPGFKKLVELDKIIAEALGVKSRTSAKVQAEYNKLIKQAGTEMGVLLDLDLAELKKMTLPEIAEGIRRVRAGELRVEPGFDGQYGVVKIFSEKEKKSGQAKLL